jgi:hypothetical protein
MLSGLLGCVAAVTRFVIEPLLAGASGLGSRLRAWWVANLQLVRVDPRYLAAVGTVAAAVLGGPLAAEIAVAAVTIVAAVLLTGHRPEPPPPVYAWELPE